MEKQNNSVPTINAVNRFAINKSKPLGMYLLWFMNNINNYIYIVKYLLLQTYCKLLHIL